MNPAESTKFEGEISCNGLFGTTEYKRGYLKVDKDGIFIWRKTGQHTAQSRFASYEYINPNFQEPNDSVAVFEFTKECRFPRSIEDQNRNFVREVYFRADKSIVDAFSSTFKTRLGIFAFFKLMFFCLT